MQCKRDKILILDATPSRIKWSLYAPKSQSPCARGELAINRPLESQARPVKECAGRAQIRTIAIHTPFGGRLFDRPTDLDSRRERKLESLTGQAPLHVPAALAAANFCRRFFPRVRRVLFCETAFYAALPERESSYALSDLTPEHQNLRRYGYYGLYHEAAARHAPVLPEHRRRRRILSVCVDFRAELAAVMNGRPVMVTGGVSPLEGLPGMTMCGDIDPSIVLTIHEKKRWGPEKINRVLTESSGVFGLTGEKITFEELLLDKRRQDSLARRLIEYRFQLAAGAGIAAMGGVDALVFSGRFAAAAEKSLGLAIGEIISGFNQHEPPIPVGCFSQTIEQIIAGWLFDHSSVEH